MPLRILLPTIGSSGDVHPVIGLGRALRERGHQVTVATNEIFSEQVQSNGLEFVALGTRDEAESIMRDPRLWDPLSGFPCIIEKALLPNVRRLYDIIAARQGPSSVVAATTLCLGARVAQERLGVRTASLHLQPSVFRSLADNGRLACFNLGPGVPRLYKRLFFWLVDRAVVERRLGPPLNGFRATLGLPPARGIFSRWFHSPELVLGLFPGWFAAPQADWPANTHLTGFVLHDEEARALPPGLEAFLGAGPPPLLVTPGSAATDRTAFFSATAGACAALGVRAMLVTNHPAQLPAALPAGVQAFPYVPFSRVLPRCAAIVYHGGIGTLAQAARAGVPHLVVPNAHDQPDNGQRIERLGMGLSVGPRAYRRGASRAIAAVLRSPEILRRCRERAPAVDAAAALDRACERIEGLGPAAGP